MIQNHLTCDLFHGVFFGQAIDYEGLGTTPHTPAYLASNHEHVLHTVESLLKKHRF